MSRAATLKNKDFTAEFTHLVAGVPTSVAEIVAVVLKDPTGTTVQAYAPGSVAEASTGRYVLPIVASKLRSVGAFTDTWIYKAEVGGPDITLVQQINVVASMPTITPVDGTVKTLDDINASSMKRQYLRPVWAVIAEKYPIEDSFIYTYIDKAIAWAETNINMALKIHKVRTPPYETGQAVPVLGTDYDMEGSLINWDITQSEKWSQVKLPHTNIRAVHRVSGVYGNNVVFKIPLPWINWSEDGYFWLRPTTAGISNMLIGNQAEFLNATILESMGHDFVPRFWAIDYDFGPKNNLIGADIVDVIYKKAAIGILDLVGNFISRGIGQKSASVDGMSSSISYTAPNIFGTLIDEYKNDTSEEAVQSLRRKHKGFNVVIL